MAQVILIEDNKNLNELLSLNLSTYVGVEVIPRNNAQETIDLLTLLPNVDLIICRSSISEEPTASMLADFIKTTQREIGLIVVGDLPDNAKDVGVCVQDEKAWEKIIQLSTKMLGVSPKELEERIVPDFVPVPIHYFYPLSFSCCDVFIRIKKSPEEFQFVKRIHSGDSFSKDMVRKYEEQGLTNFYIPKEMKKNFTNFVSDQLVSRLENDQLHPEEEIQLLNASHSIALKEIQKLGFTSATIQLSQTIVKSMLNTFKKNPEMSGLLHKIINSESSIMYQHCHMTSVVASECLKNLDLDTRDAHEKLAYASFFKDISLIDKPELSKITTFAELEQAQLNEEDWDLVFNHALEASVLVQKNPEAPFGIDEIIKSHHGASNGKGFGQMNIGKLSILSQIFIIACEFVKELLIFKERGGKPSPIIDEMYKKYKDPETVKVIKALEQTLKKSKK